VLATARCCVTSWRPQFEANDDDESEGDVSLPNYARPRTAAYTTETLKKLNFEVLEHPPYSPDIARLDYHLFGPIKQARRGCCSTTDQQLKEMVHVWLVSQPKTFYA